VLASAFFVVPHFTRWFLEHCLSCHISRDGFPEHSLWCQFYAVISSAFFVVPHFTRWFWAIYLLCHISRVDFQRIPCGATFHAVIFGAFFVVSLFTRWFFSAFFVVPHFTRWFSAHSFFVPHFTGCFPAHSLWCHISRGGFQRILCGAIFHSMLFSAFFSVPRFTRRFPSHSFWCHLLHQPLHSLQYACFNNYFCAFLLRAIRVISCVSTFRPALCIWVNFNSISNFCTVTFRSLSPLFTML
jgi:hypothetical protein